MPKINDLEVNIELTVNGEVTAKALTHVDEHQPMPVKRDDQPAIQDLVIADIQARKLVGLERYGTLLKAGNGRDALMDLYQELLDAVNYIRQVIEERDHAKTSVDSVSTDIVGEQGGSYWGV